MKIVKTPGNTGSEEEIQKLFEHAHSLQKSNMLAKAIDAYQHLLRRKPDHIYGLYNLGVAYEDSGNDEAAYNSYQAAAIADPEFVRAQNNIGSLLVKQQRFGDAVLVFEQAVDIDPGYGSAYANLCHALTEEKRVDEAITAGYLAIEHAPGLYRAHNNLGVALLEARRFGESESCFRRVLELEPNMSMGLSNMGTVLELQYRYDEAVPYFEQALASDPNFIRAYLNSSWLHICLRNWEKSISLSTAAMLKLSKQAGPIKLNKQKTTERILNSELGKEALLAAGDVFNRLGISYFLTYGTLLGCVREGGFISYDTDIDLGIWEGVDLGELVDGFVAAGFELRLRYNKNSDMTFEERLISTINLPFYYNGKIAIDVYIHALNCDKTFSGFELGNQALLYQVSNFTLEPVTFLDRKFLAPADTDKYLSECYGNWREPDPYFETSLSSPNIVGGFPEHAKALAYYRISSQLFEGKFDKGLNLLQRLIEKEESDLTLLKIREYFSNRLLI